MSDVTEQERVKEKPSLVPSESLTVGGEELKGRCVVLAARFRGLGKELYEIGLKGDKLKEWKKLGEMAEFGLFEPDLTEARLEFLYTAYQAHVEAEAQELAKPGQLAEEYRDLGRRLIDKGLGLASLKRYEHLAGLAGEGRFESRS